MKNLKTAVIVVCGGLFFHAPMVIGAEDALDRCLSAVEKQKTGEFIKVESLVFEGNPVYEIELRDAAGTEWEFMCKVDSGTVFETEMEVDSAADPRFKSKAKIDLKAAKAIALKRFPGTIKEIEYEIESNGDATYEIDVVDEKGTETKMEVNAESGEIIEFSTEKWEIGEEPDERRR